MVSVVQMDTTGGSRLSEGPFSLARGYVIILLKTISLCECVLLLQYISYPVIRLLSSNQKSNRFLAII